VRFGVHQGVTVRLDVEIDLLEGVELGHSGHRPSPTDAPSALNGLKAGK
jgi:hypothetical protein